MTAYRLHILGREKINNELKNIFLHDKSNNLRNLTSNTSENQTTSILAKNGVVEKKNYFSLKVKLFFKKDKSKNEIIKFDQLIIDLSNLST